jgi:hypothetical protein
MSFDINEARALVEAAKKRGAIRGPGDNQPPVSASQTSDEKTPPVILPEWLQNEIKEPSFSNERPSSPEWRSE